MAKDEPGSTHLSKAEITEAIRGLSQGDRIRLRKIARALAWFKGVDPDDLAQEAFCRAMEEDSRQCPRGVPLVKVLAGIMRGISSDSVKARKRHPEQQLELMTAAGGELPDNRPNAEEAMIASEEEQALIARAAETKRQVLALFEDDLVAQTMAEGIMDGMDGEELRLLTELDKTAFASKRRLVRRRINKAFPESLRS